MNRPLITSLTVVLLSILSLHGQLISNPQRQQDVQRMLKVQQQLTAHGSTGIWQYLKKEMSPDEKQAMQFLYAYMPLSDMADYEPSFILANVKQCLKARNEMIWGKQIPEDVFLHFVLPVRVNNENLDSFRIKMYPELKARIKGLGMKEAALEINHWCHEKVTYRGTDERTSAPLSTVKKSFGRCGEESTFAVAALRAACIPARQVYTPRWAHSDDNHAWVEVWIDGKWYYLGACEPEPEFNIGWFSEPARRAMLVHTRAFGHYYGKEQVVLVNDRFSELNLTENYAPVKKVVIKVKNADGTPADSAKVEFKLYNYAEFYPIATNYTDTQGRTQFVTGMGDLLVWASRNGKFAYVKLSVPETDSLELTLDKTSIEGLTDKYYLVPPHAAKLELNVTEEQKQINNTRLHREDSIRNAYMATFKDSVWAESLARRLKLSPDTVKEFIRKSYGNWDEVASYLEKNAPVSPAYTLAMAAQLSDKDFSDLKEPILTDHLRCAAGTKSRRPEISDEQYVKYVLSPRISYEHLSAWRSFLSGRFGESMAAKTRKDISVLTGWIHTHITIDDMANMHSRSPVSPEGVYNLRVADRISRNVFFVAACRTFGIPARLNPETQEPEYLQNGDWLRAGFTPEAASVPARGKLHLVNGNNPVVPQYYLHFTIGMLRNGTYSTLKFDENKKLTDFPEAMVLDTGHYVLVTGNRLQDGSVLSTLTYFRLKENEETTVKVEMSQEQGELRSSGKLDLNNLQLRSVNGTESSSLASLSGGEKMVLVLLDPDKEPSKHVLNDLGPYTDHFNKWNGRFVFAMPAEKSDQAKVISTYALPEKRYSGVDLSDNILAALSHQYGSGLKEKLPLIVFCDENGNIYFFSSGYKIGIGEQLLRIKGRLEMPTSGGGVKGS